MVNLVHLVDRSVAVNTAYAAVYVNGMVEIDVIGQLVDLHPGNGLARLVTLAHQRQPGIVPSTPGCGSSCRSRPPGCSNTGFLDAVVAITAIDPAVGRHGWHAKKPPAESADSQRACISGRNNYQTPAEPHTPDQRAPTMILPGVGSSTLEIYPTLTSGINLDSPKRSERLPAQD